MKVHLFVFINGNTGLGFHILKTLFNIWQDVIYKMTTELHVNMQSSSFSFLHMLLKHFTKRPKLLQLNSNENLFKAAVFVTFLMDKKVSN